MEVKEFKLKDRTIKYYSIYDLRNEFQNYIKENNLQFHLDFQIIDNNQGNSFIKGTLQTAYSELKIKDIVTAILPINECFGTLPDYTKPSNEFSKLQTRVEKKLYMILLGVSDPEESEGEIQDIQENLKEEELATEKQIRAIMFNLANIKLKEKILHYMKENFNKDKVENLTKKEASLTLDFINSLIKND